MSQLKPWDKDRNCLYHYVKGYSWMMPEIAPLFASATVCVAKSFTLAEPKEILSFRLFFHENSAVWIYKYLTSVDMFYVQTVPPQQVIAQFWRAHGRRTATPHCVQNSERMSKATNLSMLTINAGTRKCPRPRQLISVYINHEAMRNVRCQITSQARYWNWMNRFPGSSML